MPICRWLLAWLLVGCVLSAAIIAESPEMDDDLAEVFEGMAPFPARSVSSSQASGSSNQPAGATHAATSGAPSDDPNNAPIAPEGWQTRGLERGLENPWSERGTRDAPNAIHMNEMGPRCVLSSIKRGRNRLFTVGNSQQNFPPCGGPGWLVG